MKTQGALLTPVEAAERLNASVNTLAFWRTTKQGPTYVKIGRSVRYQQTDIDKFIEVNTVAPAAA